MESKLFSIVQVASGAQSLRSLEHEETFHPVVGPMIEAKGLHVDQHQFPERISSDQKDPFIIWDVGLGAAANAIAILRHFQENPPKAFVELHSFDRSLDALHFALQHSSELGYFDGWESSVQELLEKQIVRFPHLIWKFHYGDFRDVVHDTTIPAPQSVIFDPYSPSSNPELWNIDTFAHIRQRISDKPCLLSSYSRSTSVRTTLLFAGWHVGVGAATGFKEETSIASSHPGLLQKPLDSLWLKRVERSGIPGPLTATPQPPKTGPEVAALLRSHPQFS